MSGNFKFCIIVIIGTILFEDSMKLQQIISIVMVLIGDFTKNKKFTEQILI